MCGPCGALRKTEFEGGSHVAPSTLHSARQPELLPGISSAHLPEHSGTLDRHSPLHCRYPAKVPCSAVTLVKLLVPWLCANLHSLYVTLEAARPGPWEHHGSP